jgi:hypothetical protein
VVDKESGMAGARGPGKHETLITGDDCTHARPRAVRAGGRPDGADEPTSPDDGRIESNIVEDTCACPSCPWW